MISKRLKILSTVLALFAVATTLFVQFEYRRHAMVQKHDVWKQARFDEMRGETSTWLNLAGLFWLDQRKYSFGGAASNDLVLQVHNAPPLIGTFEREADRIYFEPAEGVPVSAGEEILMARTELINDMGSEHNDATVLSLDGLQWWVIARDGMLGVRVRDLDSPAWKAFEGIDMYEFDRNWQVKAQFMPFEQPRAMEYPTVLGTTRTEEAPGVLVFSLEGQQFEMIPFERNEGTRLFLVFADETNGEDTYSGGRFVYVALPDESGRTVVDFNKAYNPPCAFSDFSHVSSTFTSKPAAARDSGRRTTLSEMRRLMFGCCRGDKDIMGECGVERDVINL